MTTTTMQQQLLALLMIPLHLKFVSSTFHFPLPLLPQVTTTMRRTAINDDEATIIIDPKDAKGVIFDIDGTLADSWKLGFDATQVVLTNNNIEPITEETYHFCTRYCTPDRLARHAGLEPPDEIDTNVNENEFENEFEKVGNQLAKEFDELYVGLVSTKTAGFYNGILDLLLDLPQKSEGSGEVTGVDMGRSTKYVKVAALTNACVAYAHAVLKTNCPVLGNDKNQHGNVEGKASTLTETAGDDNGGIYKRFISIHGADTVPQPKPHPSGLLQCCNELNLHPKQCVYIGDSPSDAVAAKNAGFGAAIGVSWGSHTLESVRGAPFDYICETVEELRNLLI